MDSIGPHPFWSLHTHSKFSVNDALPEVPAIVAKAVELGYPAIGLTDHGNPSGSVQLYKAARKAGIEPLPGVELYVAPDTEFSGRSDTMHLTVAAYTEQGYRNLMHLTTLANQKFYYKPIVDFADLAALAEGGGLKGLVASTGCYGGVVPQVMMRRGVAAGVRMAETLAGWFPRLYIELQNHGMEAGKGGIEISDDDVLDGLWEVAQKSGLPCIIGRDSHYITEDEADLHRALKQLVSFNDDLEDAGFSGEGYHMVDAEGLVPFFPMHMLRAGLEGLADLAEAASVRIPDLESFKLKVPNVTFDKDPQVVLEELVFSKLTDAEKKSKKVMAQIQAEFDVIGPGDMAPYLLVVNKVCEFMREKGIRYAARGSAAGSYVNYKLEITQVNPIKLGLRFDRFLSSNRMKPPDVDLDVEHTRRDEVIAFIGKQWAVQSVGSLMKYSLFEDENAGEDSNSSKGSLRVKYYSTLKKKGVTTPPVWAKVPKEDRHMLFQLADRKLISGYGTHAAGYIVAPNRTVLEDLPLAWIASSKKFVTAYGKKDIEQMGLLKLDLLGLRTQTAIRLMEESTGIQFDQIPDTDPSTYQAIGRGDNAGVFQLDGYAMTKGCKQLKPRTMRDVIASLALFRPATLNSGATKDFLERRRGNIPVPERHPDIMNATKETFGVLLYQEQVMDVMQSLGMTPAELEEMLDAVKASNEYSIGAAEVIQSKMPHIRELAGDRGWGAIDIDWLIEGLGAYADYSFNKAHAASYGYLAYRTAWMKKHHPLDFWTAMAQSYADHKKITTFLLAAKQDGIRILPPHVNKSGVGYTMVREHNAIRRGLISVKGIGKVAATELVEHAPYASLTELGESVMPRRVGGALNLAIKTDPAESGGAIAALWNAGALRGLEHRDD